MNWLLICGKTFCSYSIVCADITGDWCTLESDKWWKNWRTSALFLTRSMTLINEVFFTASTRIIDYGKVISLGKSLWHHQPGYTGTHWTADPSLRNYHDLTTEFGELEWQSPGSGSDRSTCWPQNLPSLILLPHRYTGEIENYAATFIELEQPFTPLLNRWMLTSILHNYYKSRKRPAQLYQAPGKNSWSTLQSETKNVANAFAKWYTLHVILRTRWYTGCQYLHNILYRLYFYSRLRLYPPYRRSIKTEFFIDPGHDCVFESSDENPILNLSRYRLPTFIFEPSPEQTHYPDTMEEFSKCFDDAPGINRVTGIINTLLLRSYLECSSPHFTEYELGWR